MKWITGIAGNVVPTWESESDWYRSNWSNWMDTPNLDLDVLWICFMGIPFKCFFSFSLSFCFFFSLSNLQSLITHMHLVYTRLCICPSTTTTTTMPPLLCFNNNDNVLQPNLLPNNNKNTPRRLLNSQQRIEMHPPTSLSLLSLSLSLSKRTTTTANNNNNNHAPNRQQSPSFKMMLMVT